ncbi:hypothetical protein T11_1465 [Trichinella zimbabwensis]|uniref:Uncharacterized protein n=1 Tax=Trichinella zimbabwensis TaxID=268475 RepID=A0A0V1I0S7_9BILA|nr:hypothetical protein T11_1465 [Trichinella zimbabwensis]
MESFDMRQNSNGLSFQSSVLSCLHIDKSLPKFQYDAVKILPADKNLYLLFTLAYVEKFCLLTEFISSHNSANVVMSSANKDRLRRIHSKDSRLENVSDDRICGKEVLKFEIHEEFVIHKLCDQNADTIEVFNIWMLERCLFDGVDLGVLLGGRKCSNLKAIKKKFKCLIECGESGYATLPGEERRMAIFVDFKCKHEEYETMYEGIRSSFTTFLKDAILEAIFRPKDIKGRKKTSKLHKKKIIPDEIVISYDMCEKVPMLHGDGMYRVAGSDWQMSTEMKDDGNGSDLVYLISITAARKHNDKRQKAGHLSVVYPSTSEAEPKCVDKRVLMIQKSDDEECGETLKVTQEAVKATPKENSKTPSYCTICKEEFLYSFDDGMEIQTCCRKNEE